MCCKALRICVLLALCVVVIQSAPELDCTGVKCLHRDCPLGSSLYKPPTECCQTCRPNETPTDCTLVKCALLKCPSGQKPFKPSGECCSVCRPMPIMKFCRYNGRLYLNGQSFMADCNECTCENGVLSCTKKLCPVKFCRYNGRLYLNGQSFMAVCNECTCENGVLSCTKKLCPATNCIYKGKTYRDRQLFRDDCNTCRCINGAVACTRKFCKEKPGRCPKPWPFVFCIKASVDICTSDRDCNGRKKCCTTGCRRVCSWPIGIQPIQTGCLRNGKIYKDGAAIPSNKCRPCKCYKGKITCRPVICKLCVGYTPPGECCPRCGGFPLE